MKENVFISGMENMLITNVTLLENKHITIIRFISLELIEEPVTEDTSYEHPAP